MNTRTRFGLALLIGVSCGLFCSYNLISIKLGAGDFGPALRAADDLLSGTDPYRYLPGPYNIPYPIPAALLAMPFMFLKDYVAGGLFFGMSTGMLAWFILSNGTPWQLFLFLSAPFYYASAFAQWSPLVLCLYFSPAILPVLLMKPNIALPLAVTRRPSRLSVGLTALIGIISLLIYPSWPIVWLRQLSTYQGIRPPLFVLPWGPLILLALLRYRDNRAWILLWMAIMPQRMLYDQLALLLVARNRPEMLVLGFCSWIPYVAVVVYDYWGYLPGGWQQWILFTLYFPALLVLLKPMLVSWIQRRWNSKPTTG